MSIEKIAFERIFYNYYAMSEEHYGGMETREHMDFEIVKNALNKSVPELVKHVNYTVTDMDLKKHVIRKEICCPRCDRVLPSDDFNYCPYCGQRLYDIKQI